jgi:SOS-response transcriptional repressor LexA
LLNDVYNKLTKLKPAEIVQIENALKRITNQDGILQQSINRMKQAKDAASKMKAENLQKALDKSVGYLNIASTSIGKVKIVQLLKVIGVIFGMIFAFKVYKFFNNVMSELESIPFIGDYFKSDEPSPSPNNTEPNKTEETW